MTTLARGSMETPDLHDAETNESQQDPLTEDDVFHVLQNERRRLVLKYLEGRDDQVRMRDVAEQVAAWEHDTTVQALTSTQRQRVYIPLYQNHLPKLDKLGIIEYNQSRGIVERTDLADQLHRYLDPYEYDTESVDGAAGFPWELPYLGVTGLGGLLLLGKAWSLPVLGDAPTFPIAALILVLFTFTSSAQLVNERLPNREK